MTFSDGDASANIPMKQFATYFQDDWRVNDRFTLNFGLRYDLMTGYQIDESLNPNFVKVQAAGAAGLLKGIAGLENFGLEPKEDHDNFQPRIGGVLDVRGDGKDIVRAGWGVYTDVGYTNSNVLFAAADSTGKGFGQTFNVNVTNGIRNPDGSFYAPASRSATSPARTRSSTPARSRCSASSWIRASSSRIRCRATSAGRTS